jgi:hypothetical protein
MKRLLAAMMFLSLRLPDHNGAMIGRTKNSSNERHFRPLAD